VVSKRIPEQVTDESTREGVVADNPEEDLAPVQGVDAPGEPEDGTGEPEDGTGEEQAQPMIHYRGSSSIREVTAEQWQQVGIEGQGTVVWNSDNNHALPLSDLTEDAQRYLGNEPGFEIVNPE